MKRILSISGILALALLFTSAISIRELPQDPPRGKKAQKHIKMIKIGDDGKKVEIDTVLQGDNFFVFDGDTIGGHKAMKWVSKEGLDFDMDMDFDIDCIEDGKGKMIIVKSGKAGAPAVYEFKTDEGDSAKQYRIKVIAAGDAGDIDVMKWNRTGDEGLMLRAPQMAHKKMMVMGENKKRNVIDLSDPGIISFEKKELKDGKEKITIVREKPSEENEEIIIHRPRIAPMMIHEGHPHKTKQIKVIAGDDGQIEILEDGKTWTVEEMEEGTKVIEKEGKKIIIKKIKEGDAMKVNVEVEEKEHEEEHK